MNSRIFFIIIAYHPDLNGFRKLLRVLAAESMIIIDNGQTLDASVIGNVTLLSQPANTGYGAAANIGMTHAISHGATWCVILNQDTSFTPSAVVDFTKQLTTLEPCVAGPVAGGLDHKRWSTILPSENADYVTGSCIAIHRKVIDVVGYFYEPYFLYYEEADYCIRAKRAGFPIKHVPIPGIDHEESLMLGKGSPVHQYYLARNHMLFVERQAPMAVKLYELFRLPKTISEHISRGESGAISGLKDYYFRRFGARPGGVT